MALLLYSIYSFLKTLALHSKGIFVKKKIFDCKFRRFKLIIFYKILMFWSFWVKFFIVLLTLKCVTGLLLIFIKTFFITFATVSQPFSVKIVICNSHIYSLLDPCGLWIFNYYFQTTIFRLKLALLWHLIITPFISFSGFQFSLKNLTLI